MSNRKLVSVQEITNIEPIEGADRIEVARILGWRVVVGKDMHLKPGDRVAYFETDSLLPAYDPRYKAFQARGQKTMIVGSMEITGQTLYNRHKELFGELKEQCRRKPRHPIDSTAYRIRDGRTIPAKEKE